MYESILVATDGSDDASTATEHAVGLARRLDATVGGVAVVETRTGYDNAIVDPEEVDRRLRERGRRSLDELESLAERADVPVTTELRSGAPHEEILAAVGERDADLVVIGATGRSSFKRALLGGTVDAVVRLSPVPVLVVGDDPADEVNDGRTA